MCVTQDFILKDTADLKKNLPFTLFLKLCFILQVLRTHAPSCPPHPISSTGGEYWPMGDAIKVEKACVRLCFIWTPVKGRFKKKQWISKIPLKDGNQWGCEP